MTDALDLEAALKALQVTVGRTMDTIETEIAGVLTALPPAIPEDGPYTITGLFRLLFDRAKASRILISYGMDFDADIILRAFYETHAKILMLCAALEADRTQHLQEYWDAAESTNRRKKVRASLIEKQAEPSNEVATAIFSLLQDDRVTPINPESLKARRKAIEQKWSFNGIMDYFSSRPDDTFDLSKAKLLLHTYGMASHFVHADHSALDLMEDRYRRTPQDLRFLEAGHASRILTDQASLAFLCAIAASRHFKGKFKDQVTLATRVQECLDLSKPIMDAFYGSQKEFYESYGYKFSDPDV